MKKIVIRITAIAIALLMTASIVIVAVSSSTSHAASKSLYLSAKSLFISVGDTVDINSFYTDGSSTSKVAYFSNNSGIANIQRGGGFLTAVGTGSTTIYAQDTVSGHKAYCTVTVASGYVPVTSSNVVNTLHKGRNGFCDVLGINWNTYQQWLKDRDHNGKYPKYYLGTPFDNDGDYRMPNGDRSSKYATGNYGLPTTEPVTNCTGFVWHVLQSVSSKKYLVPAETGWVTLYRDYSISRYYFDSKSVMLNSGLLEKGDIIWQFVTDSEYYGSGYNHIGIYYGNGKSDVFWHSTTPENHITEIRGAGRPVTFYVVLKARASVPFTLNRSSATYGAGEVGTLFATAYDKRYVPVYTSNNPNVAYAQNGKIYTKNVGNAVITAKCGNQVATCSVKVIKAPTALNINCTQRTLGIGETYDFNTSFKSGEGCASVAYKSSNPKVCSVIASGGIVKATGVGTATITAYVFNGVHVDATVNVGYAPTKITLNRTNFYLGVGESFDINASIPAGQKTSTITYTSSNAKVATVGKYNCITKGIAPGSITVTATAYNGVKTTTRVTVVKAPTKLYINTPKRIMGVGENFQFFCKFNKGEGTGIVRYTSSDPSVCSVNPTSGLAKAAGKGTATITASVYNGVKVTSQAVVMDPATDVIMNSGDRTMSVGEKFDFDAWLPLGQGTTSLIYSSSNAKVVDVAAAGGVATAKAPGTTKVSVKAGNGVSRAVNITVKYAPTKLILNTTDITIGKGESFDFNHFFLGGQGTSSVRYYSYKPEIADITEKDGIATAKQSGTVILCCKAYNGVYTYMKVNVLDAPEELSLSDEEITLNKGETFDLGAVLPQGTASRKTTFTSTDNEIAEVKAPGGSGICTITAKAEGITTITVTTFNGLSKTCVVNVTSPKAEEDEPVSVSETAPKAQNDSSESLAAESDKGE